MSDLNAFDIIAAEVSGTGHSDFRGLVHPMMLRLQLQSFASIAALAEMADDSSRNAIANQLIEAALDEVISRLDDTTREQFNHRVAMLMPGLLESKQLAGDTQSTGKGQR